MSEATLTSLALPNGIDPQTGKARLSLFLSPRLTPDDGEDRLEPFATFLDWPRSLAVDTLRFVVTIEGAGEVDATLVSPAPRSDLWRALFGADTFVRGPSTTADMVDRPMVTYPHREVAQSVKSSYQSVATQDPTAMPEGLAMTTHFDALMPLALRMGAGDTGDHVESLLADARDRALAQRAEGQFNPDLPAVVAGGDSSTDDPAHPFAQFEAFHYRPKPAAAPQTLVAEVVDKRRIIDFHAALTALGDHPALLRQLGLIVDLEFDGDALPSATAAQPGTLSATPVWPGAAPVAPVTAPGVAFVRSDGVFRVAGRPAGPEDSGDEIVDGLVALGNGRWDLSGLDVDGAVSKAIMTLASVAGPSDFSAGGEGAQEPPAALRTAGLALARSGTADHVRRNVVIQHQASSGKLDAPLFAEDVTRGYRLDVLESRTGKWRSVHARRASYTIAGGPAISTVADEGFVRRAVTQPPAPMGQEPPDDAELYVHDVLCRWEGWSLAAARPGKSISADPRAPQPGVPETQPQRLSNEPIAEGFPLQITSIVEPGTLPRLRFGESYHVRLRTVDLAGNGPTLEEADALVAKNAGLALPNDPEPHRYRRFEPVGSPELVVRAKVREGESLERLVIRSDFDATPAQWAAKHKGYRAGCERHVVPPKVAQLTAEQHGMFDSAIGTPAGAQAAYEAARKEKGALGDKKVMLSDGSTLEQKVHVDDTQGHYVVNQEERLVVPYLPDPLASGVTLAGLPNAQAGKVLRARDAGGFDTQPSPPAMAAGGEPEALVTVPFGHPERWPEIDTFRLRLAGGSGAPEWDGAARLLAVHLPKAGRARITLSCFPPQDRLDDFTLRQWIAERMEAEEAASDRSAVHAQTAALGRTWPISPGREIELVHAVQRPVNAPVIRRLAAVRPAAATFTHLGGAVRVHGASSDRLEVLAEWTDTVDRLEENGPRDITGTAHVLDVPIHLTSEAGGAAPEEPDPAQVPAGEYVEARDVVRLTAPAPDDESGRVFLSRHEFGDTRRRVVRYRGLCTSRFRDYFPVELAKDPANVSRESAPLEVDVPSSARPAAPHVLYIVPMFAWERAADPAHPNVQRSRRRGGGLRVYLDRPWFSSGLGEQLAVVMWPDPATEPPEEVRPVVTRWGRDPIWSAITNFKTPSPGNFPRAVGKASGLTLEEHDVQVAVAGHEVAFDADRRLWFCDIEIDAGESYTPFVRLALARWQPHSVKGVELSRVVLCEYAQLAPERSVSVVHDRDDPKTLKVSVTGATYREGGSPIPLGTPGQLGSSVAVRVERRVPGTRGPLGWISAMGGRGVGVDPDDLPFDDKLRWRGRVRVPADRDRGEYRVVIREHERFAADDGAGGFSEAPRLVFAETVEV